MDEAKTPDADSDPADLVTAYCAPGLKGYATRLLEDQGERVREVVEHPYMAGRTDVILMTAPDWAAGLSGRRVTNSQRGG